MQRFAGQNPSFKLMQMQNRDNFNDLIKMQIETMDEMQKQRYRDIVASGVPNPDDYF